MTDFKSSTRALFLLAPLALAVAAWALPWVDANGRLGLAFDRAGYLERARQEVVARVGGGKGWDLQLESESEDALARYYRSRPAAAVRAVALAQGLAPAVTLRVKFQNLAGSADGEAVLAPDGRLVGFLQEAGFDAPAAELGPFLASWLGPEVAASLVEVEEAASEETAQEAGKEAAKPRAKEGAKEGAKEEAKAAAETAAETGAKPPAKTSAKASPDPLPGEKRHEFRLLLPELPELELRPWVRMEQGGIAGWGVETELEEDYAAAYFQRGGGGLAVRIVAGILLGLFALAMVGWGLWRYWLRWQESEVSHGRTLLLGLLVAVLAGLSLFYLLISSPEAVRISGETVSSSLAMVAAALLVGLMTLPFGLVLGAVWSGCEGDMRQIFPSKLISLDAVVAGRWTSLNPARAFLQGAAFACWVMLGQVLVLALAAWNPAWGPDLSPNRFLLSRPWQFPLALGLAVLVPYGSLGLLAPVSLLRRWTRIRWRTVPVLGIILWLSCLLLPWVLRQLPTWNGLLLAAVWTAAFLVPFFLWDVFAAFWSFLLSPLLWTMLSFLHQPAPALKAAVLLPVGILGAFLLAAALILRRGREVSAQEVRPGYARNMLERAALTARLEAARQARDRLLPAAPPAVAGFRWTLERSPEAEGAGEYYDFFPLAAGGAGFALADLGEQGLAAALRLTLAKGFLLSYSRRGLEPAEIVDRLERRLAELVTGGTASSLLYGRLGGGGSVDLAAGQRPPWILVRRASGLVEERQGGEAAPIDDPGPPSQASPESPSPLPSRFLSLHLELEPGDRLILLTGVEAAAERSRQRFLKALGEKAPATAAQILPLLRATALPPALVMVLAADGEGVA